MRKLSLMVAALFLFASAPAFAQAPAGTSEQKSETKVEKTTPSGDKETTTTTKKHTKKHKKASKKRKAAAADAGM